MDILLIKASRIITCPNIVYVSLLVLSVKCSLLFLRKKLYKDVGFLLISLVCGFNISVNVSQAS